MNGVRTIVIAIACWLPCAAWGRPAAQQPVTACCFSPDNRSIVVARHDAVTVLSTADGREQRAVPAVAVRRVCALAFSGDGTILAVAGGVPGTSGKVVLLNGEAGEVLGEIGGFTDIVTAIAFGPDGTLAAASADRSAALFTLHDNGRRSVRAAEFVGHAGPVLDVEFSPDGRSVVTASADRSIKVWEKSGKLSRTLTHHTDIVQCLAIRPAAATRPGATDAPPWSCASGGDDKTVRVWQPGVGRMVRIVRRHEGSVLALAYAPDGTRLFSAGADGLIRAIDADSDQIHFEVNAHPDWVYALAVSPNGKWLASGDWTGHVKLWSVGENGLKSEW